ncbi:MAG TPA: amidotransferase, partial [Firmicutes bacterium]|nr:amidotransferase [Bacillota bacterium]
VIGFQFHMESTEESIFSLIDHCAAEMVDGIYIQNEKQICSGMNFLKTANRLMEDFLDRMEAYYGEQE